MTVDRRWRWLAVAAGVLAADQASKAMVLRLPFERPVVVAPVLNILPTVNDGVSFSLLHSASGVQRWPLALFAAAMVAAMGAWFARTQASRPWLLAGLAAIMGGAVGNLMDRLVRGEVVDFVQVHLSGWSFAVFNMADAGITVGVGLLLLDTLLQGRRTVAGLAS